MDLQSFQVCSLEKSCDKHRVPRSTLTVVFALLLLLVASLCEAIEPSGLSSSASSSSSHRQQKFLVLIDAGSAGSRIHVFSWRKGVVYSTLTEVCQKKINPALTTFMGRKMQMVQYLNGLLGYAEKCVDPYAWSRTTIHLLATAGLRRLDRRDQDWILGTASDILDDAPFVKGQVRLLSGDEEALFDWIAVIAAFRGSSDRSMYNSSSVVDPMLLNPMLRGVADMGGESKQIAFVMNPSESDGQLRDECEPQWRIRFPSEPSTISLFSRSYLGFGLITAMNEVAGAIHDDELSMFFTRRPGAVMQSDVSLDGSVSATETKSEYVEDEELEEDSVLGTAPVIGKDQATATRGQGVSTREKLHGRHDASLLSVPGQHQIYHHPCYAPGIFPPGESHDLDYDLYGAGNFTACLELVRQIFLPKIPQKDIDCIKRSRLSSQLVGIDSFSKVVEVLDRTMGENELISLSPQELYDKGTTLCEKEWMELHKEFSHYMPYRAQRACFGAVYIYFLVTDVYGIDINDSKSFSATQHTADVSWTLGAAFSLALKSTSNFTDSRRLFIQSVSPSGSR